MPGAGGACIALAGAAIDAARPPISGQIQHGLGAFQQNFVPPLFRENKADTQTLRLTFRGTAN